MFYIFFKGFYRLYSPAEPLAITGFIRSALFLHPLS